MVWRCPMPRPPQGCSNACLPVGGIRGPAAKEPFRECLAIARVYLADTDIAGLVQHSQERARTSRGLAGVDLRKHPARAPVDGYEQVAPAIVIKQLRQILDVHILIALEHLVCTRLNLRLECLGDAYAGSDQAPSGTSSHRRNSSVRRKCTAMVSRAGVSLASR